MSRRSIAEADASGVAKIIAGYGLKISIPVLVIAAAFFLHVHAAFGGGLLIAAVISASLLFSVGNGPQGPRPGAQSGKSPARKQAKTLGSCWDMPVCSPHAERLCPVYKAQKPCWRLRTGCQCDGKIRMMLTAAANPTGAVGSTDHIKVLQLTDEQKRDRCRQCSIYSERQAQKHKIFSPLSVPITLVLFIALSLGPLYKVAETGVVRAMKGLSFLGYHNAADKTDIHALTILTLIALGILTVSSVLKFVEYLIFKAQV